MSTSKWPQVRKCVSSLIFTFVLECWGGQCRPVFDKNCIVDQGLSVHGLSLFVDNIAVRNATI